MSAMSWIVALIALTSSGGAAAARAAIATAVSSSASSSTQRHTSPTRSASSPVEHLAEQHRRHVAWGPAMLPEHPGVAAAGMDAELQEPGVEAGRPPGQAQVAHERQVHAGADRGAVDRGDGGQRSTGRPAGSLVDREQALAARTRRGGDRSAPAQNAGGAPVTTTAPTSASASSSSKAATISSTVEVERVATFGVVQGDDRDAVGHVGSNQGHIRSFTANCLVPAADADAHAGRGHGRRQRLPS